MDHPKVALLVPAITSAGGGVAEAVRLLHDAIRADGRWDVEIHAIRGPGFDDALKDYGHTKVLGARRWDPTRFGFSPGLLRNLLNSEADILHIHGLWGFHCLAAYLWHLQTGRPYVISPHGMLEHWILQRSRLFKKGITLAYQNNLLKKAAALHVLTGKEADDVKDASSGPPLVQIPNFAIAPSDPQSLGLPRWWAPRFDGRNIFLFFGRIHEKKGCIELCKAWDQLCQNDPQFAKNNALVFCGWNDGLAGLESLIDKLNRAFGNTLLAGPQYGDDKWRSLSAATYMVLPSKSEGLPLSVLESWAVGTPVIMTQACNLPEGFDRGAALETSPEVKDIASALSKAATSKDGDRQAMQTASTQLMETSFSRDAVGSRMIALYQTAWLNSRTNQNQT